MFNIFKPMGLNEISWEMGGYGERRSLMTEPRDMATVGCPGSEEESKEADQGFSISALLTVQARNSVLWGMALCIIGCLTASLAFI